MESGQAAVLPERQMGQQRRRLPDNRAVDVESGGCVGLNCKRLPRHILQSQEGWPCVFRGEAAAKANGLTGRNDRAFSMNHPRKASRISSTSISMMAFVRWEKLDRRSTGKSGHVSVVPDTNSR